VTEHVVPQERDLPAGRLSGLKEDLMAHIEHDLETEPAVASAGTHRRWRRIGLTAAALATGFGLATSFVADGNDSAGANTAERTADGAIVITIREGKNPEDLERRLNDLGVPAVVDFLESGFGCDRARSTGWVQDPAPEALFTWAPTSLDEDPHYVLQPDLLPPGQTMALEFQIDEHGDEIAANVKMSRSTGPVGDCDPVPDDSIVDAETGVAGG
jgi:hypothetical protein